MTTQKGGRGQNSFKKCQIPAIKGKKGQAKKKRNMPARKKKKIRNTKKRKELAHITFLTRSATTTGGGIANKQKGREESFELGNQAWNADGSAKVRYEWYEG